jgi:hypothetical protein
VDQGSSQSGIISSDAWPKKLKKEKSFKPQAPSNKQQATSSLTPEMGQYRILMKGQLWKQNN